MTSGAGLFGGATRRRAAARPLTVAVVGNPNSGKTTLFNALTGMRQKVGNYAGVTVESKQGRLGLPGGNPAVVLDLPGLYSLTPHSPDELIAREVLFGVRQGVPVPDVIVDVIDASNLARNLYMTSQLLDLGRPVVIALTMTDTLPTAAQPDTAALSEAIGVPVVSVVASRRTGIDALVRLIEDAAAGEAPDVVWEPPDAAARDIEALTEAVAEAHGLGARLARAEAVSLLMREDDLPAPTWLTERERSLLAATRVRLADDGLDFAAQAVEARYAWIERVCSAALPAGGRPFRKPLTTHERVDRIVMHPILGYALFVVVMAVVFQSIFTWVQPPMDWIRNGVNWLAAGLTRDMAAGPLRDLIRDGVLAGVGNTLVFLPQILLLFFFISLLEDTGYLARAAFLMDRLMSKVGLHGKSFIPLVSSFACAIPGIMATRTIGDRKARLITILVAPLMSCSARLPVYALMIGAFVPSRRILGIGPVVLLSLPGLVLLAMYFLGMVAAFSIAWVFHRTLLRGVAPSFILELPPYRIPSFRSAAMQMLERAGLFLKRAGTIILAVSVVLWALSAYPRRQGLPPSEQLQASYVGHIGRVIEPAIRPLGFDWKMGIGIVSSFVAREVFVSAMGTVYNVGDPESDSGKIDLQSRMRNDIDAGSGRHVFTPLVAVCLMVYYVLAMQCMSTVAVVRRETNGWRWPLFQVGYMSLLAWVVTFALYQGGRALGWG